MAVLGGGMAGAAVHVKDNAGGAVEGLRVLGPAVAIDDGGNTRDFIAARLEQQTAGGGGGLGDEDGFCVGGGGGEDGSRENEGEEEARTDTDGHGRTQGGQAAAQGVKWVKKVK